MSKRSGDLNRIFGKGYDMRRFIIDTDTASDDAVAIMAAAAARDVSILGVTTVAGNVSLEKATRNALQVLETCGADIGVYPGAAKPLFRELVTCEGVHGKDGMGDQNLVHPTGHPQSLHGADFILEKVKEFPGEVEIVALGPVTNIALAILKDRETMKQVKHIWSMGTAGFGPGNSTPVAEFNVFVDAESYAVMLESGIPLTIIGFDLCLGETALNKQDLEELSRGSDCAKLAVNCTKALLSYNLSKRGEHFVDLPDAVAMGVALWPEITAKAIQAYCYCCTREEPAYGQVIIYDVNAPLSIDYRIPEANASVIRATDSVLFKKLLKQALM